MNNLDPLARAIAAEHATPSGTAHRAAFALDDVSILNRLIACAQEALARRPCFEPRRVADLVDDTRAAIARPCEGERVLDDHTAIFAQAITLADQALHLHERARAGRFNAIVAALLPHVQDDLYRALQLRAAARPTP